MKRGLTCSDGALDELARQRGGMEVGEPGGKIARLAAQGFIEIDDGCNGHRLAKVTRDGLAAMLLWRGLPR